MVTFDASSTNVGTGGDPTSHSHTVANESSRLLLVVVGSIVGTAGSAVTYAGVSMTQVASIAVDPGIFMKVYSLVAPATGSNTVAVTTGGNKVYVIANSFYGVNQTTPLGDFETRNDSGAINGTTTSLTPGSTTSDLAWDALGLDNKGSGVGNASVGASQTEQSDVSDADQRFKTSTEAGASGTTTMSWTVSDLGVGAQNNLVHAAVAIKSAASSGAASILNNFFLGANN